MKDNILNKEAWKTVPDFPRYSVSNLGHVNGPCGALRLSVNNRGYQHVTLVEKGVKKDFTVHKLVGMLFVPNDNPKVKNEINHKDFDKLNNRADNLEWCDSSYNNTYGERAKRVGVKLRKKVEASRTSDFANIELVFESMGEAQKCGFYKSGISASCHGRFTTYKGYYWRTLERTSDATN